MGQASEPNKYCLTILRFPVREVTREEVFNSAEWFDVLEAIVSYSNWRFTFLAQEVQSTKFGVFIGWKTNTNPALVFTEQDRGIDNLLDPLHCFCGPNKVQVTNLYNLDEKMGCYDLRVENIKGEERIMEVLTLHGPGETVEQAMLDIEKELNGYVSHRFFSIGIADHSYRKHALSTRPLCFRELQTSTPGVASHTNRQSPPLLTLTLFIWWADQGSRSNFHDPKFPDLQIPDAAREYLGSDFWDTRVAARLKEVTGQGVSVTSWDYEKAKIAVDRDGRVTTIRQDKIW